MNPNRCTESLRNKENVRPDTLRGERYIRTSVHSLTSLVLARVSFITRIHGSRFRNTDPMNTNEKKKQNISSARQRAVLRLDMPFELLTVNVIEKFSRESTNFRP